MHAAARGDHHMRERVHHARVRKPLRDDRLQGLAAARAHAGAVADHLRASAGPHPPARCSCAPEQAWSA